MFMKRYLMKKKITKKTKIQIYTGTMTTSVRVSVLCVCRKGWVVKEQRKKEWTRKLREF